MSVERCSLRLLPDLPGQDHFLSEVLDSQIHQLLLAILLVLLRDVMLLSAALGHFFSLLLEPFLRRCLLLSVRELLLPKFSILLVLPLQLLQVVLLICRFDLNDFGRFHSCLLDFLQDALLFVFEQVDSVFDFDLVVSQTFESRIDVDHFLMFLCWLVRYGVPALVAVVDGAGQTCDVVLNDAALHAVVVVFAKALAAGVFVAERLCGRSLLDIVLTVEILVRHHHLIGKLLGFGAISHDF